MVNLPPRSQPEGDFASTPSSTPTARAASFWYRSTALGTFSGWYRANQKYCPKYGLHRRRVRNQ